MRPPIEPDSFQARLRLGLENIGFPSDNPGALAREFNRRHRGAPISVDATRKWLLGEAVPTQAKLRSIAAWLAVSPEWLGFGDAGRDARAPHDGAASADLALLAELHQLDEKYQRLARQFIHKLVALQDAAIANDTIGADRMV